MATYRISGVWKNSAGVKTHYAFHTASDTGTTRAVKKSKDEAVKLLETSGNSATTWLWNYNNCMWAIGEKVTVVSGATGKYLRSNPDKKETNNLDHLIDFDWIAP